MERSLLAMSVLTFLLALLPSRSGVGGEILQDPPRQRQSGLAKWVDQWRESRPATREVADALDSELLWAPLKTKSTPTPLASPAPSGILETEAAPSQQSFPGRNRRR